MNHQPYIITNIVTFSRYNGWKLIWILPRLIFVNYHLSCIIYLTSIKMTSIFHYNSQWFTKGLKYIDMSFRAEWHIEICQKFLVYHWWVHKVNRWITCIYLQSFCRAITLQGNNYRLIFDKLLKPLKNKLTERTVSPCKYKNWKSFIMDIW